MGRDVGAAGAALNRFLDVETPTHRRGVLVVGGMQIALARLGFAGLLQAAEELEAIPDDGDDQGKNQKLLEGWEEPEASGRMGDRTWQPF
jgi:hypothetical protein